MGKKVIVFFLAMIILGSLCCENAKGDLSKDFGSVTRNGVDFTIIIESPIPDEIINSTRVNLNFSINDTGLLLLVRSISYTIYLDGEIYNQTQQAINNKTVNLLDEALILQNVTQGEHTIKVNATIDYDFYSISCGGPFTAKDNITTFVHFIVNTKENDTIARQPTDFSPNMAIVGGAITITIVFFGSAIWVKKSKKKIV